MALPRRSLIHKSPYFTKTCLHSVSQRRQQPNTVKMKWDAGVSPSQRDTLPVCISTLKTFCACSFFLICWGFISRHQISSEMALFIFRYIYLSANEVSKFTSLFNNTRPCLRLSQIRNKVGEGWFWPPQKKSNNSLSIFIVLWTYFYSTLFVLIIFCCDLRCKTTT